MKPSEKDLVRVESETELRPGMTVWTRCSGLPETVCTKMHSSLLISRANDGGWTVVTSASVPAGTPLYVDYAIRSGRCFRLRDLADDQEQTTQKRTSVTA